MLQGDLVLRVYARDAGRCRVCLVHEPRSDRRFMVVQLDMSEPRKTESMGDVILICETCKHICERWLALMMAETHKQNDTNEFGGIALGIGA